MMRVFVVPWPGARLNHHHRLSGIETIKLQMGQGFIRQRARQSGTSLLGAETKTFPKFIYRSHGSCFRALRICCVSVWVTIRVRVEKRDVEFTRNQTHRVPPQVQENRNRKKKPYIKISKYP